jgi:hypothetical protein
MKDFSASTWKISLLLAILFTAVFQLVLKPGYAINDDLKIIWIASGYTGGAASPFLVYSNVLLGFLISPLYTLQTSLNWEILLFVLLDFISLWVFLDLILSKAWPAPYKTAGTLVVFGSAAYFTLNITYTSTASLVCLAGLSLLLESARARSAFSIRMALAGISLVLVASLLRIQMVILVLGMTLPVLIFFLRTFRLRQLALASLITAGLVLGCYAFDRLYVRSSPGWAAYYAYNRTRQMLHDAHRLDNLHSQIKRIGWSSNDQELFAHWFFPDEGIYSLDHLQYLVAHTPGTSQDILGSIQQFLRTLTSPLSLANLAIFLSIWLGLQFRTGSRRAVLPLLTIWAICLGENLFLTWAYKDPEYVVLASLAEAAILTWVCLGWFVPDDLFKPKAGPGASRWAFNGAACVLVAGLALILVQSIRTSQANALQHLAYRQIVNDLETLQVDGKISPNALIVSPAHGLPIEWSDPLITEFPAVNYFDTGWITFSPPYEQVLHNYDIHSLPDALYQREDVYLMTRTSFTTLLARYYREHENLSVRFEPVYLMPNPYHFPGYDDIALFKVEQN